MLKVVATMFCMFLIALGLAACGGGGSSATSTPDKLTIVGSGS